MTKPTNAMKLLREHMLKNKIHGCIFPSSDPHASEYIADYWKTRSFFSGFTGSAGTLVVTEEKAGLWTDSRYFLQAEDELKNTGIDLFKQGEANTPSILAFLENELQAGNSIYIDAFLFSTQEMLEFEKFFLTKEINIIHQHSIIDEVWKNRPILPTQALFIQDEVFSGKGTKEKQQAIRKELRENNADILLLNALDEIAWLLNIRGNDIEYNPLVIAYASVEKEKTILFIDLNKISAEAQRYFSENDIIIAEYDSYAEYLSNLHGKKIWIDPAKMNYASYLILSNQNTLLFKDSPILHSKSIKNETEIAGIREAMVKDGVALSEFLMWFEESLSKKEALTEISVGEKLKDFRAKQNLFFGESFAAIVGYKEHGAIVHYKAKEETNSHIKSEGFLLIDSGAQFYHGTTDITRTFALGALTDKEKRDYTLVLKGHIALAQAQFPEGTCGYQLDILARQFLWKEGLNYGHGTGHGVGCFLCVHEGPQGIRPDTNKTALKEGMVISNEPGLYLQNAYGIRLENLILVQKSKISNKENYFYFETLTLFPFEKKAIELSLLNDNEKAWINNYHQTVFNRLSPRLDKKGKNWLAQKCKTI